MLSFIFAGKAISPPAKTYPKEADQAFFIPEGKRLGSVDFVITKSSMWEHELTEVNCYDDTGFLMLETASANSRSKNADKKAAQTLDLTDREKIVSVCVHTNEENPC